MRAAHIVPVALAVLGLAVLGAAAPGMAAPEPAEPAAVVSAQPEDVALVIYQDSVADDFQADRDENGVGDYDASLGLALVSEWRTIEVPAGETTISFRGVAEGIVPQTAKLDGLPATLVESNQDYDLLSPASLIGRQIGAPVKRITTNPVTGRETVEEGILRSGPNGVVLEVNGRFEALNCGGQPQRLVFQRPPGLADKPVLSLRVRVATAGRYRVRLSYLATGLLWRARYVLSLDAEAQRLDMTGWVSLINTSGTTFADATTEVVAGDVERSNLTAPTLVSAQAVQPKCWPMDTTTRGPLIPPLPPQAVMARPVDSGVVEAVVVTGSRRRESSLYSPMAVATQSELGDYKLYSLPFRTTVAAKQSKQVMMLRQERVRVGWIYIAAASPDEEFEVDDDDSDYAGLSIKTTNTRGNGLGVPLPGGKAMLFQAEPGGGSRLIANTELDSAPVGLPVEIYVGRVPKVRLRRVTLQVLDRDDDTERRNRVEISNDTDREIVLEYRLFGDEDVPYKIVAQSSRSRRVAGYTLWTLKVPAHGRRVLTYSVRTEY